MAKRSRKRMSKEELAAPDEIEVALNKIWDALTKHKKVIIGAFAGLIALGVVLWVVNATTASARDGRATELRTAVAPIGAQVGEEDPASKDLPGPKAERFTDRATQLAAAEERLTGYATENSGDDALEVVDLALANVKLEKGDAAGAIAMVDAWLGNYGDSPARTAALELKARALTASGDTAKATEAWNALAQGATGKLKAIALKMVGDLANPVLAEGGDATKARAAYDQALAALGPAPADDPAAAIVGKPGLRGELENRLALLP